MKLVSSQARGSARRMRTFVVRGALYLMPLAITLILARFAFHFADSWLGEPSEAIVRWIVPDRFLVGSMDNGNVPGFSLVLLLMVLLALGTLASWRLGRNVLSLLDQALTRVPFAGGVYRALRKVTNVLGTPEQGSLGRFSRAVLIDVTGHGQYQIAFVTAETRLNDSKYYTCMVPNPPNPTGGGIRLVPEHQVIDLGWDASRGFEILMSYGVLTPADLDAESAHRRDGVETK